MKKLFKSLSVICLALVLLCPLALVGCSKNYTINIQIVENADGGAVYLKNVNGISAVGDNTVKEGEKFEYYIKPSTGYYISKVEVNGVPQTGYDVNDAYLSVEKVKKDVNVKVYFAKKAYTVTLYCQATGGGFEVFKTIDVLYQEPLNLNNYGGEVALWYVKVGNKNIYRYNNSENINASIPQGFESNYIYVKGDTSVYCDKTAQELINEYGLTR